MCQCSSRESAGGGPFTAHCHGTRSKRDLHLSIDNTQPIGADRRRCGRRQRFPRFQIKARAMRRTADPAKADSPTFERGFGVRTAVFYGKNIRAISAQQNILPRRQHAVRPIRRNIIRPRHGDIISLVQPDPPPQAQSRQSQPPLCPPRSPLKTAHDGYRTGAWGQCWTNAPQHQHQSGCSKPVLHAHCLLQTTDNVATTRDFVTRPIRHCQNPLLTLNFLNFARPEAR
jgi:hypothetical protein